MQMDFFPRPNHTVVHLENKEEASLFTTEGVGLFSIKGLQLTLATNRAVAHDVWPVDVTLGDERLRQAGEQMLERAARLEANSDLAGFGDFTEAKQDAADLRQMSANIDTHFAW